ncbi:MAG: DNA helicase RecQ [Treponematales bacterium]
MALDKHGVLKACFGYSRFRPGQEEVIDALLARRDALAVMPTGAGKSLCYQIPAMLLDGLTVVVSPLISLMRDQVEALKDRGLPAGCLNSSLPPDENARTLAAALSGECRLLYIAPERLQRGDIRRLGEQAAIRLVVIDEAHCVSQWGHDFRPRYLDITGFIARLPERPVTAAFTATATGKVRDDISATLKLKDPFVLVTGFNRENLYFEVQRPRQKLPALLALLRERRGKSGIVYCATRKAVEEVRAALSRHGFAVTRYHAGLGDKERRENQDDFLYDRRQVMVATNAFGMGIDKANVSFVIHYNMPRNIESYYQEAGRAGRDGEPADCILLYSPSDVRLNEFLITCQSEGAEEDPAQTERNLELLKLMTFYAASSDCLRSRLLSYFGEDAPPFCGNCSNCNNQVETDITQEACMIISCVYRVEQRGRRFGRTVIIDILRGVPDKKVREHGLDSLSTWGIMADIDANRVRAILDFLIERGILAVEGDEYPVVRLTTASREALNAAEPLTMMLPGESAATRETAPARRSLFTPRRAPGSRPFRALGNIDKRLFERLKELRSRLARNSGVPAYIVFTDASLRDMCLKRPRTREQFLEVSGVGKAKTEKYGADFLRLLREYENGE